MPAELALHHAERREQSWSTSAADLATGERTRLSAIWKTRGYEILDRNYRSSWGEIDIIARQRDVLAFVEVKTRHSLKFGRPAAAVTREKQIRLRKTAWCYLRENQVFRYRSRFDIIEILDLYGKISLNHLKNCF